MTKPHTFHVLDVNEGSSVTAPYRYHVRSDRFDPDVNYGSNYDLVVAHFTNDKDEAEEHCRTLNEFASGGWYHWRDGKFFTRRSDGAVAQIERLTESTMPRIVAIIPPNEWASIVSSVSAGGETGDRYRAALAFHGEP